VSVEEIRRRHAAAGNTEWEHFPYDPIPHRCISDGKGNVIATVREESETPLYSEAIVHARADIGRLLAELDRVNTALGACRTALNHHLDVCTDAVARSVSPSPGGGPAEGRCPTCEAPEPRLHPAIQADGEVAAICRNPYHGPTGEDGEPNG
jgi:hypothetical protein